MGLSFLGRKKDMSHERVRELLSVYLDSQLPVDQRTLLEHHLQQCGECSQELVALRTTRQLLRNLPPVRLPRSFTLEAAPRPVPLPRGFFWLRAATAVGAAAFAVLLVAPAVLPMAGTRSTAPVSSAPGRTVPQSTAAGNSGKALSQPPAPAMRDAAPAAGAAERPLAPAAQPAPSEPSVSAAPAGAPAPTAAPARAPAPAAAGAAAPSRPEASAPVQPQVVAPAAPAGAAPATTASPQPALPQEDRGTQKPPQPSVLMSLQAGTGALALLLGLAMAVVWRRHRGRQG